MTAVPLLELRTVSARRGSSEVLTEVSFALEEGQAAFLMGTAGSGKSSLLKAAAGILLPSEGEVLYRGRSLARLSRKEELEFRRRSGFLFQDAALWSNQSLFENLSLPFRLHNPRASNAEIEGAVRRAAALVGCGQNLKARPSDLSGGEKRLVGLARALVLDPELLFLDEPVFSLDEEAAERVGELIADLRLRGRTLLVVSANSDFVGRMADTVGVIRSGRLLAYGPYAEAARWSDPALRSITGRLKQRRSSGAAASGTSSLLGAWETALSEGAGSLAQEGGQGGNSPPPDAERPPGRDQRASEPTEEEGQ